MSADDLTEEDRFFARRWAAVRGRRPRFIDDPDDPEWSWDYLRPPGRLPADYPDFLPWTVGQAMDRHDYPTEDAAWDALALALKRVRADAAIPGETQ